MLAKLVVLIAVVSALVVLPWLEMRYLPSALHDEFPPGMLAFPFLLFSAAIYFRRRRRRRRRKLRNSGRSPD